MTDRLPAVVQAAWLYYEDGLTQAEIATLLSVSRATVGRLLEDARRSGVITFQFHSDRLQALSLSQEIREVFGLSNALVIPDIVGADEQQEVNDRVAKGAAQYLGSYMPSGSVLAMGWGDTVSRTLGALRHTFAGELKLVTMTGGANAYVEAILGGSLDNRSTSVRMRASVIPAPIIASSSDLAIAISAEREVQRILSQCGEAPYALVGVGTPTLGSTLMTLGYVDAEELNDVVARGAVGDVLGQFFDEKGRVVDAPIHQRRIGVSIMSLRGRRNVIGVAGGRLKAEAIMAAVYGGYLDVLVTDESTARIMLANHQRRAQ